MGVIKQKLIAIAGVSYNEEKYGFKIFRDLIKSGYNVQGINPRNGKVLERKIYKSLKELEIVPDLVITVVPHQITERIVEECRELGIKQMWMQPGSESEKAILLAQENGLDLVHDACFLVQSGLE